MTLLPNTGSSTKEKKKAVIRAKRERKRTSVNEHNACSPKQTYG